MGALPAIPYLLCLDTLRGMVDGRARLPLSLLLLVATVTDAAAVLSTVTRATGYLALDHVPPLCFALPAAMAALWCLWRNGDAVGYAATLWTRVFPALLLLIVLLQLRHYRARWLLPMLGNGWRDIARGGVRTAGWFVPATAVLLVCDDEGDGAKRRAPIAGLAFAGAVAALLLVLRLMMAPASRYGDGWLIRLDALLTNGRAPLYLQLPMILSWFIGLFHLLTCEGFAASALLQRLIPALDGRLCAAAALLGCTLLSCFNIAEGLKETIAPWLFIAAATVTGVIALLAGHSKGGGRPCAE